MLNNAFIGFLDNKNIGLDTKSMSLGSLELEILPLTHFEGSHFEFFWQPFQIFVNFGTRKRSE